MDMPLYMIYILLKVHILYDVFNLMKDIISKVLLCTEIELFGLISTLTSGLIQAVRKKQLNRMWLCAGISPLYTGYRPGQSVKRCGKSCSLHSKKFLLGGCGFFVSDVISGRLFSQLHLALGANR